MTTAQTIIRSGQQLAGMRCVATADTERCDVRAVVASERYGLPISAWAVGTTRQGHEPGVFGVSLRDVTIVGSGVSGSPSKDVGKSDRYHGILFNGSGLTVENLHVHNIPGCAGQFGRPANPRHGQTTEVDRIEHSLRRLTAYRVYQGFEFVCADGGVSDVRVCDFRDWGVRFGGAIDATDVHVYGGTGPGIVFAGGNCRARGLVAENVTTGIEVQGSRNVLDGVRCFSCEIAGVVVNGRQNQLRGVVVYPDKALPTGIFVGDQRNTVSGEVEASGIGCAVYNGVGQRIELACSLSKQPDAIGLVATAKLQFSTIDLVVDGGKVGADFSAGLGENNVIRVRTRNTATPVVLPSSWPASNDITVNGVRQ